MFQQQEQDPTNLYLANLPPDFTETDLQKLLEGYGATISTRVLKNGDGSSRCVGFARMDNEELCAKIIRVFIFFKIGENKGKGRFFPLF